MRLRGVAFVAMLALGGCPGGFTGERALFAPSEGAPILGDRGVLLFPTGSEHRLPHTFERAETGYDFAANAMDDEMRRMAHTPRLHLIPINETPEDDYIAQIQLSSRIGERDAIYYAFALRAGPNSLRVLFDPREFKEDEFEASPSDTLCLPNGRSNAECEFESRAAMIGFYLTHARENLNRPCDPEDCETLIVPDGAE